MLVDYTTGDDAGVFRLANGTLLVQTVDFFSPVVDDPFTFGAIAAANALSDVYAMGGRPLTALSIAALPEHDFPPEWASAILLGGFQKLQEAGCVLLGGHSVRDQEIKFGYAVTGVVEEGKILTISGAQPGDNLVLTKALGTGILSTALKAGEVPEQAMREAALSMATLNDRAAQAAQHQGAHAATDITGFGLVGHALGLARQSGVSLEFRAADLPIFPAALDLALRFQPGGLQANRRHFERELTFVSHPDEARKALLFDPQTSGGLLIALPPETTAAFLAQLPVSRVVGAVVRASDTALRIC